jgi:O-glycosyl hydrolase
MLAIAAATFLAAAAPDAPPARASIWVTAKATGDRLASKEPAAFEPLPQPDEHFPTVIVDPAKAFQEIVGFGGALTDAAAETFAKLPEERQRELLDAYFDPAKGIGYSLARTHINSCDFSSASYAYAEPGDVDLKTFSVRFVEEYEKEGVPMWGLTVQNEPMATQTWESCLFTGEEERDFVRDHLGPALERAGPATAPRS